MTSEKIPQSGPDTQPPPDRMVPYMCLAALLFVVFQSLAFEVFEIPSESMEPGLVVGDYIIVSKYPYGYSRYSFPGSPKLIKGRYFASPPQRGDVMVFKQPRASDDAFIKRVIGLPDDRIQVINDIVYINNIPLQRVALPSPSAETAMYQEITPNTAKYTVMFSPSQSDTLADTPADVHATRVYKVPKNHYFVMGDNRNNSNDSRFRQLRFIPFQNIIGRAEMILFSKDAEDNFRQNRFLEVIN